MHHQKLICYKKLLELAKQVPDILANIPRGEGYLVDQLKRALSSAILNMAEGNARISVKERRRFFDISLASISEVAAVVDILRAYSYISESFESSLKEELRICFAMTLNLKKSQVSYL